MITLLLLAQLSLAALDDHPALRAGVEPFHRYISSESSLPARDREVLILRIAALSGSKPVWNAHVAIARDAGLTTTDILRAGGVPDARGSSGFDGALLRAADELHAQSFVSDGTWRALAARYTRQQLMDAVFTVAHYSMWATIVNTTAVPAGESAVAMPAA